MPLSVLRAHGSHGLVSIKGIIYDVRGALDLPGQGEVLRRVIGHDISRLLACQGLQEVLADGGAAQELLDQGFGDLTYDEILRLERAAEVFSRAYSRVGVLDESDLKALLNVGDPGVDGGGGVPDVEAAQQMHSCIEANDVVALRTLLRRVDGGASWSGQRELLANACCPRTGLSPLHKAVEAGLAGIVAELLAAGASKESRASLYDGDTPLDLAKRLGSSHDILDLLGGSPQQESTVTD